MTLYSVYIHIPFCRRRCVYCDFVSNDVTPPPVEEYVNALLKELEFRFAAIPQDNSVVSVYVGGGTPSLLPAAAIAKVVSVATSHGDRPGEVTVEINPGDADERWMAQVLIAGVNRFSLGAQAMDDERLQWLGRRHSVADIQRGVRLMRDVGVSNVSVDFMYATPAQTTAKMSEELQRLCDLGVNHVSAYELTVAEGTPLARQQITLPDEFVRVEMWHHVALLLQSYGLSRYEVSNYAQPGNRSVHNCHYWKGGQYVGIGSGAHGFLRVGEQWVRYRNDVSLNRYMNHANLSGCDTLFWGDGSAEVLSESDLTKEMIMLGFRWVDGIAKERLRSLCAEQEYEAFLNKFFKMEKEGLVIEKRDRWVPTEEALLIADTLALRFF